MDVTPYIQAKSDQLNADSLTGGPITVQIEGVTKGSADQPVVVAITGGHMPWKPSKTALRVLSSAWGTDTKEWVGRWVTLYRDPTVTWAGIEVGGVRIKAMSHIEKALTLNLAVSRGKKQAQKISVLKPEQAKQKGAPTADLDALLADNELVRDDVDRWRAVNGKPPLSEMDPETIPQFAAWLADNPAHLQNIRSIARTADNMDSDDTDAGDTDTDDPNN